MILSLESLDHKLVILIKAAREDNKYMTPSSAF